VYNLDYHKQINEVTNESFINFFSFN